jgi:hypothetical protein
MSKNHISLLSLDSLIPTDRGLLALKFLNEGNLAFTGSEFKRVVRLYNNIQSTMFEVILSNGLIFHCSADCLISTPSGSVPVYRLQPSDITCIQSEPSPSSRNIRRFSYVRLPNENNLFLDEQFAELLGLVVSNGIVEPDSCSISFSIRSHFVDFIERLCTYATTFLGADLNLTTIKLDNEPDLTMFTVTSPELYRVVKKYILNLELGPKHRYLSHRIMMALPSVQLGFLSGLFASTAKVRIFNQTVLFNDTETLYKVAYVKLIFSSITLASMVQLQLLTLGIQSSIEPKFPRSGAISHVLNDAAYRLVIHPLFVCDLIEKVSFLENTVLLTDSHREILDSLFEAPVIRDKVNTATVASTTILRNTFASGFELEDSKTFIANGVLFSNG